MRETEESLVATLETLESSGPVADPIQGLADGCQLEYGSLAWPERLINTATAKKLTTHFSLERIQRILGAAKDLLAQNSESDSGEDELVLLRAEDHVKPLTQVGYALPWLQFGSTDKFEQKDRRISNFYLP